MRKTIKKTTGFDIREMTIGKFLLIPGFLAIVGGYVVYSMLASGMFSTPAHVMNMIYQMKQEIIQLINEKFDELDEDFVPRKELEQDRDRYRSEVQRQLDEIKDQGKSINNKLDDLMYRDTINGVPLPKGYTLKRIEEK